MGKYIEMAGSTSVRNNSLLGSKLDFIEIIGEKIIQDNVEGLIAEAGVYKGGSARLLATMFPDREILLFDSFEGMLENDLDSSGGHKKGDFSDISLEQVQEYLKDKSNCRFFKGWFPETADFLTSEIFSLVHIDMDYYQSTVSSIDVFWKRMNINGVMIFDDYEWVACPGVKKALQEFFPNRDDYKTERIQGMNSIAIFKIK